jgi:hypothetical protein
VLERCLAKSTVERYQHASEVRAALAALGSYSPAAVESALCAGDSKGRHRRLQLFLAAVSVFALFLIAALFFVKARHGPGDASANAPVHSLAVLPLENMSGDPSQGFFADGMTGELTTQLAQISALRVISRTSVVQYKTRRSHCRRSPESWVATR